MRALLLLPAALLVGCFPTFPDEGAVKNLRTLAIQQDPAVLVLDGLSLPRVTMRALTVDPLDLTGDATVHEWTIDLGEEFEDAELIEQLIPPGPWESEVELDFAALLAGGLPGGDGAPGDDGNGGRDEVTPPEFLPVEHNAGLLPVTHFADNGDKLRESVKFLNFLVPDFENLPLPPTVPGTRPQQAYEEALAAAEAAGPPEGWNANPNILSVEVGGLRFEGPQIREHLGAIDVGTVSPGQGLRIDVVVTDDGDPNEVDVELYWTHGEPGLPEADDDDDGGFGGRFGGAGNDEPTCYEPVEGEPEAQDSELFGGGADLGEPFEPDRAFGWTAPCSVLNGPIRLFLIARDDAGGVAWQELRVGLE